MSTCPLPFQGLVPAAPGYYFDLVAAIIFPIAFCLTFSWYLYLKNSSIYLRKRPLKLTIIHFIAVFIAWFCGPIYNLIGPAQVPCALFFFLLYIHVPIMIFVAIINLARYSDAVSAKRLVVERINLREASTNTTDEDPELNLSAEASFRTLMANFRVIFCRSRRHGDLILKARFSRSWGHIVFYSVLTLTPYMFAFLVRLGTDPLLYGGCYGCELTTADCALQIAITTFNMILGFITIPSKYDLKRDPLQIKFSSLIGNYLLITALFGYVLFLIDPNNLNSSGIFLWRSMFFFTVMLQIVAYLLYPIITSRRIQAEILVSENFNRTDCFDDVMKNRAMRTRLRQFLSSELSLEILLFIEAVDSYKANFSNYSIEKRMEIVKSIQSTHIQSGSYEEINISSKTREELLFRTEKVEFITYNLFDQAYAEIKEAFLKDGFVRFLDRLTLTRESHYPSRISSLQVHTSQRVSRKDKKFSQNLAIVDEKQQLNV